MRTDGARRHNASRPRHRSTREEQAASVRPILVMDRPRIDGPFDVERNPLLVEYQVVAHLALPAADTEVVPAVVFRDAAPDGEYVDLQWTTTDDREPRGVWERSARITLPRQFAIAGCRVTGGAIQEREAGA